MQNYERDFQKQFTFKSQIGSGTFGIVKKCIWNKNQKLCAVKCVDNVNEINIEKIQQEATIMKNAKSDYSLELYDHFFDRNNLQYILVMPFCKFGSLEKKISENWNLDSILLFMYQITQAFVDFSQKQITHLDLKPQNILIKSPGQYVVCDFGCSKVIQELAFSKNFLKLSLSKGLGTPDYAAPQIQLNNEANKYSDIWSLGVIIYRMIYHKLPFTRANMGMSFLAWKTSYEGHSPQLDPIVAILKRMLSLDKRPSWKELRTQIYQILKIDDKIEIVTSASEYKQYVKNLSVLGTCLLHHIDRIQDDLQVLKVNYRPMINTFMVFLQKLTESEINPDLYYMFELTKSRIKMDEKQHIAEIHKQIQNIIKERQIKYSEANKSLSNLKNSLLKEVKAFSQSVRKLKEDERKKLEKKPENEYFKVKKIVQFVSAQFGSNLSYCKKHQLEEVVHYLVYS